MDVTTQREAPDSRPRISLESEGDGAHAAVKLVYGLLGAVLLAYLISLLARAPGDTTTWLDGWGVSGFELLVSALVLLRGALSPRDRQYALLLGLGGCGWALGDFAMTGAALGGGEPASPSLGNFLWASFFPGMYLALLVLMRREVIKVTPANVLDGVIVLLAAAAAMVAFAFHPILAASGEPARWVGTNLVYPVGDIPVVCLTIIGCLVHGSGRRARWYLLTLAALANLAGDTVALFPKGVGASGVGFVLNSAAWPTSLFLISCAVWLAPRPASEPKEMNASGFVIPAVGSVVALAILVVGIAGHSSAVAAAFAVATVVASGARFGLALRRLNAISALARRRRDELEQLQQELTARLDREAFATRLSEALEIADEERDVFSVIERATVEISEPTPMELLLADSSQANLSRSAANPTQPAPGCGVRSPFSCVAVRRGTPVTFASSEALNACPHLRGRPGGACSAVCVPVGFMGRALGVLHTTGPDLDPLPDAAVDRLSVLAAQAGARIGTVRAFEKTQLQASTDGLTGLVNRRTAEQEIRSLIQSGRLFAVAIGDLDRFKQLNDTHGHDAGDRALRLFAQTATRTLRDQDLIARWGGEEFVIVLPDVDRFKAIDVMDRIRADLAAAHPGETAAFTASFGVTDSEQSHTIEDLLSVADAGLYAAKDAGRDRAVVGDPAVLAHPHAHPAARPVPEEPPILATRRRRPLLHEAADEPLPRPNGVQIR